MREEMSFPARGNLRLVAIGGSKLAREAIGTRRATPTKRGRRGGEDEVARGYSGTTREGKVRSRRATAVTVAVAAAVVERKREGPLMQGGPGRRAGRTNDRPV